MEKLKGLFKRVWLPLAALGVIAAGAALLMGGIHTAQAARNAQTVLLERAAAPAAPVAVAPAATEAPGPQEHNDPFAEEHGYEAVDLLDENSPAPTVNDIDYKYAAQLAADCINTVFGDGLQGETLYAHYYKYESMVNGSYEVLVGSPKYEQARYVAFMEATTGQIRFVEKLTPTSQLTKNDSFDDVDHALMETAREDTDRILKPVSPLIEQRFANGRRIEEVLIDGIQWDFRDPENDVLVDCKIRMNEGECYMARVTYPDIRITQFHIYPLGWDSCLWGYWEPEQAQEMGEPFATPRPSAQIAQEAPAPTPQPTPN